MAGIRRSDWTHGDDRPPSRDSEEMYIRMARMFHEISTPLFVIRGRAELLQVDLAATDPAQAHVTALLEQAARLEELVMQYRAEVCAARSRDTAPDG